ncbi:MAG TPA: class I adenylate-forming enzyme family protein [Acidimicrobiia bacterium]|nr:class I adenylate-forming enzyme family protein [Acidimicrobiia bacterium]
MSTPIGDDPRLAAILAADAALTAPGAPFEIVEEDVLGERMPVFRDRFRSMRDLLRHAASTYGDRDAYVFSDGRRYTFASFEQEVRRVAAGLRDRYGIGPGSRVAACAANCPEWLLTWWACGSLDAVLVAMNGWWTGPEMRTALDLTEPALFVADEKRLARLDGSAGMPTVVVERDWSGVPAADASDAVDVEIAEDDPFMLIFTSGTTGRPKAAVLSHRSVVSYLMCQGYVAARGAHLAGIRSAATVPPTRLATYPLFHVSGVSAAGGSVLSGAKTVWPLGRFDAGAVIELTKREGIAVWGGGLTHVVRLLEHPDVGTVDAQQIVSVGVGGSATPPAVIDAVEATFPHLTGTMSSGYGSTETGLISLASNWMLRAAPETVGPPLPTVAVRITDELGNEVPEGVDGHVEARSWQGMIGYWRNPEADAETIRPGRWIRTGDFGRLEDGVLFIVTRLRDLIIRGGENVYPFEIEHRLDEHPDVVEVAVLGVDSPTYGQEVKAVVVVRPGSTVDADELRAFCAERLASYKVPAVVELRTEPLPRTASGKVMKHVLAGAENTFVEE